MDEMFKEVDSGARAIDAHLRAEVAAGRLARFVLLVQSEIAYTPSSSDLLTTRIETETHIGVVRTDGTSATIDEDGASIARIAAAVAVERSRPSAPLDIGLLRDRIAFVLEERPSFAEPLTSADTARRLREIRDALQEGTRDVLVPDGFGTTIEAKAIKMAWLCSDEATPLRRMDRTWLSFRCVFRVRVSDGPRMYGELPEPERFEERVGLLDTSMWPTVEALADLVVRAVKAAGG